jgi:hypothetical protein
MSHIVLPEPVGITPYSEKWWGETKAAMSTQRRAFGHSGAPMKKPHCTSYVGQPLERGRASLVSLRLDPQNRICQISSAARSASPAVMTASCVSRPSIPAIAWAPFMSKTKWRESSSGLLAFASLQSWRMSPATLFLCVIEVSRAG